MNPSGNIRNNVVRYKEEFKPIELDIYREKHKQAKIKYLERKLAQLKEQSIGIAA